MLLNDAVLVKIRAVVSVPLDSECGAALHVRLDGVDQPEESLLLLRGSGILGLTFGVEPADVADADGVGVVAGDMCSSLREDPARLDGSVQLDDEVIAHSLESSLHVPSLDVGDVEILALLGGRAMNDDACDLTDALVVSLELRDDVL